MASTVNLYVELLDDGTRCLRPVEAIDLGDGNFRLIPTVDYDPEDERWQFPPGSIVRCRRETWDGGEVLVAREIVK